MKSRRPSSKAGTYFPALTGLRAFAAALVFGHHFVAQWFGAKGFAAELVREGYVGVSVFFTLSGFLITQIYFERICGGTISFGEYWLRRFFRVYPVYAFMVLVKFAFDPPGHTPMAQLMSNLTLTQAFFRSYMFTGIAPAWSLTIEECFYLLAPLVFLFIGKHRNTYLKVAKGQLKVRTVLLLAFVIFVLWEGGWAISVMKPQTDFLDSLQNIQLYNIFGRFPEFAMGMFAGLYFVKGRTGIGRTAAARRWFSDLGFLAGMFLVGLALYRLRNLQQATNAVYGIYVPGAIDAYWIVAAGTTAIIWSIVSGSRVAHAVLGNPVSEYLGRISYVFYLVQESFYADRVHAFIRSYTPFAPEHLWVSYAGLSVLAALLYEAVEKPIHIFGNQQVEKRLRAARYA